MPHIGQVLLHLCEPGLVDGQQDLGEILHAGLQSWVNNQKSIVSQ
jgi:hypothetical protein